MKTALALILTALLAPAPAAVGQDAPAKSSPDLELAERHTAEAAKFFVARRYAEALLPAARAVELREKELGGAHPLVGQALVNLAAVESKLGKQDEAKGHYRRAAEVLEKGGEAESRNLIKALDGLARLEPDLLEAAGLHRRTLALKEKAYGAGSREAAVTVFTLGHLDELLGDNEGAEKYFERFLEVMGKTKAAAGSDVAVTHLRLSCVLRKRGRREEAAAAKSRAFQLFDIGGENSEPSTREIINGKIVSKPAPGYPPDAKLARADGSVTVEVLVDETGGVLAACAANSGEHPSLRRSAERAAYAVRFTPTYLDGKPVKVTGTITYNFVLK